MPSAADRLEFAPPQPPGMLRAFGLAVLAHILLLVALTWGVSWKRDSENLAVEAELWSSIPQQAAPKPVEVQPPPPQPKVIEAPKPPPPVVKQAQIAVEKEKKPEPKKEPPKVEPKPKPEPPKKVAEAPKPKASTPKQIAEADAKKMEALRQENLKRMAGLAGATGSPSASGAALQSAGPSAGYAGRIRARVKPNIVFTEDIAGNPTAEVEVRTAPDGTIVGRRLLKSSGEKAWDDAVLKAIDKTEVLPRDVDGRVPSPLIISFRPKD
ncbi:MAG: cell envelope integrity protein TolA [Pseudomonadota bacterium]